MAPAFAMPKDSEISAVRLASGSLAPGTTNDFYHELLDSAADKSAELQRSWETYGVLPFLLPAPVVYLLATGAKGGGLAEANMRADDAIWIEKVRAKRAGKDVDD